MEIVIRLAVVMIFLIALGAVIALAHRDYRAMKYDSIISRFHDRKYDKDRTK